MHGFGIGLQSGTRETLDVVGIEAWISGRPLHRPFTARFLVAPWPDSSDGHFRIISLAEIPKVTCQTPDSC